MFAIFRTIVYVYQTGAFIVLATVVQRCFRGSSVAVCWQATLFIFSLGQTEYELHVLMVGTSHDPILFVLSFYGPLNLMGSCQVQSVYLTALLLGRFSPLSGQPVLCTIFRQKLTTALLESAEWTE